MESLTDVPLDELWEMLEAERNTLKSLAQYNGTAHGARTISLCRNLVERIEQELDRRGEL